MRTFLSPLAFALLLLAASVQADPMNFMIEGFTFIRPPDWQWIETDVTTRRAQLKISDPSGPTADVMFYFYKKGDDFGWPENCIRRWQAQFQERADIKPKIEKATFGVNKVTYAHMQGTYKIGKPIVLLPNNALYGAIVETEQGNFMIRMTGPKDLIEKSMSQFRVMVESALKES